MSGADWEIVAGRCGGCSRFHKDYGTGPRTYGHCGPKPRSGSITVTTFKCDVYVPRPEVAPVAAPVAGPAPRLKVDPFDVTATTPLAGHVRPSSASSASTATRRPDPIRRSTVVSEAWRSEDRDHEVVDDLLEGETVNRGELRGLIREAIEETLGIGEVELLDRFKGGTIVIRPGVAGTSEKELPIDALMHKIVMVRDNLRVLESKINAHEKLDDADRVGLQQYITRCYGSLTTFNMLMKDRDDWFRSS